MFESYAIVKNISGRGRPNYMAHFHDNTLHEGDIVLIKDKIFGDEETEIYGKVTAKLDHYRMSSEPIPEFLYAWFGESIVEIEEVYSK